jgi:hypothetical protein
MNGSASSSPFSSSVARISAALRTSINSPARKSSVCAARSVVDTGFVGDGTFSVAGAVKVGPLFGERTRMDDSEAIVVLVSALNPQAVIPAPILPCGAPYLCK